MHQDPITFTFKQGHNLLEAEKTIVASALASSPNHIEAARRLGISRHALKRRMAKHRLDKLGKLGTVGPEPGTVVEVDDECP